MHSSEVFRLETDIEEFEDNPEEYIRKDIEKSGTLISFVFHSNDRW